MNSSAILTADILDIVFENRNKAYGAYELRKHYGERLYKALFVTLGLLSVAFILLSFLSGSAAKGPKLSLTTTVITVLPDLPKQAPQEQPKQQQPKEVKAKADIYTPPVITDNPEQASKLNTLRDDAAVDTKYIASGDTFRVKEKPVEHPVHTEPVAKQPEPAIDVNTPLEAPEVMPAYPGGMPELYKFLQHNLTNPQDLEEGQVISVRVKFIVGFNGELKGFEIVEDGGRDFNNEVIRVLKKMPKWIPGRTKGHNVSVYFTLPVKFVAQ